MKYIYTENTLEHESIMLLRHCMNVKCDTSIKIDYLYGNSVFIDSEIYPPISKLYERYCFFQ